MNKTDLFNAYLKYNVDKRNDIEKDVIKYILLEIGNMKDDIISLLTTLKINIKYDDLVNIINEKLESNSIYKANKNFTKFNNDFLKTTSNFSRGLLLIEETDDLKIVDLSLDSILYHNALVISDINYFECSFKNLFINILKNALETYEIDANLINIFPYEECYNDEYDLYNDKIRELNNEVYIYLENIDFEEEVNKEKLLLEDKGIKVIIIDTNFDETINLLKDKYLDKVSMYTKDREKAHDFINLVHANNIFINSSLLNEFKVVTASNKMVMSKNIMYSS